MSAGRCKLCHCYTRNCPEGKPNHKNVATAGSSCAMNSLGRHYRDQGDTTVPVCDYAGCTFFSTDEFRTLDYPTEITLGPVTADPQPNNQSSEISAIMELLKQQQVSNEERNLQMSNLQKQVTDLIQNGTPALSSPPTVPLSQPASFSMPTAPIQTPVFSLPNTVPTTVVSAASNLSAALQSGFGQQHNGFSGFNPGSMGSGHGVGHQQQFDMANPLAGMGASLGTLGLGRTNSNNQVINSVDQLYAATTVNKQLRAHEFAASAHFPYKSQLNQNNCNAIAFAYGSFKHLEAIKSGLITNVSDSEFLARLRHLKNVFEVACLSSNLSTFSEPAWQVAREYDARVIADIESGVKTWDGLANGLETDAIYVAKEIVELKNKAKKPLKSEKGDVKPDKAKKDPKTNGCTTYNTHRASEGCFWEHQNKGESCVFEHFCNWCKVNRNAVEKHKSINCEFKPE